MTIRGVAVMRRSSDSWLNATQLLKVAGFHKRDRAQILEREILIEVHEKIQGGYGKYQGVWISYERGVELCRRYGVEKQLHPLLNYDIGQDGVSIAERRVGAPMREEVMPTQLSRSYDWSKVSKSWPGSQNHTAPAITTKNHSQSFNTANKITAGSRMRSTGGHMSDAALEHLSGILRSHP